jgi:hypothetical protein
VQLRLGGPHIGPLLDDLGGQAQRQLRRQLQRIEFEGLGYVLVRQIAPPRHESDRASARAASAMAAARSRPARGGFLRRDVDAHGKAQPELIAQDLQDFSSAAMICWVA